MKWKTQELKKVNKHSNSIQIQTYHNSLVLKKKAYLANSDLPLKIQSFLRLPDSSGWPQLPYSLELTLPPVGTTVLLFYLQLHFVCLFKYSRAWTTKILPTCICYIIKQIHWQEHALLLLSDPYWSKCSRIVEHVHLAL